jgi:Tfp pilus assembly protein PilO
MAEKKKTTSVRHLQISKSQSTMLASTVAAIVIVIFSLFATKAMIVKGAYQRKALHARRQVVDQLKSNYNAANQLLTQYKVFANQDPNILGGSVNGATDLDGDNPRIVLDALPSSYDAPALASSVEKILGGRGISLNSLTITDDQASNSDQPQAEPTSATMPLSFQVVTSYPQAAQMLQDFERSIRPFDLNTINISGTDDALTINVNMNTYFQPAKSLNLQNTKEVK